MQDAENVAALEAAEQRRAGAGAAGRAVAGGRRRGPACRRRRAARTRRRRPRPGLERPAEPAADGDERADAAPGVTPPLPEESSAPLAVAAPRRSGRRTRRPRPGPRARAGSRTARRRTAARTSSSFSDPEDFVDDVSEEGGGGRAAPRFPVPRQTPRTGGRLP